MIALICVLSLVSLSLAEKKESLWDKVKGKVEKITGGASLTCQNPYISGPFAEAIFCDGVIPEEYLAAAGDALGRFGKFLKFGPETVWCSGLACVYRAMGCAAPTYRVEAKIIEATGRAESCAESAGLDPEHCFTLGKFVHKIPGAKEPEPGQEPDPNGKKRSLRVEDMNEDEIHEAKLAAAVALHLSHPEEDLQEVFDEVGFSPEDLDHHDKRNGLKAVLEHLQICSTTVQIGAQLFADKLGKNITGKLGPCGTWCNAAVCAYNVLCGQLGKELLESVNRERNDLGCTGLKCKGFLPALPSQCEGFQCKNEEGYWNLQTCPPPKRVIEPSKKTRDEANCCETCFDNCAGVPCGAVECPPPAFPLCAAYKIDKFDAFDCCPQCIDPCAIEKAACPKPPASCPEGQVLGPGSPGDCCLSCRPSPCLGVRCPAGTPAMATQCKEGQTFVDNRKSAKSCSDCCPRCDGATKDPDQMTASASAVKIAGGAMAAAAVASEL